MNDKNSNSRDAAISSPSSTAHAGDQQETKNDPVYTSNTVAARSKLMNQARFILVIIGIVLSMFMVSVNSTVVAPALGKISTELNAPGDQIWLATSYIWLE